MSKGSVYVWEILLMLLLVLGLASTCAPATPVTPNVVTVLPGAGRLTITFGCGDMPKGYFDVCVAVIDDPVNRTTCYMTARGASNLQCAPWTSGRER